MPKHPELRHGHLMVGDRLSSGLFHFSIGDESLAGTLPRVQQANSLTGRTSDRRRQRGPL